MAAATIREGVEIGLDPAGIIEDLAGVAGQHFARQSGLDPPPRSLEELEIESLFQPPETRADSRHDDIVSPGGSGQTATINGSQEHTQID